MTTTMDQRTAPEAFADMTIAAICRDVSQSASFACGLDGKLSEDVVTWSIVMEPAMVDIHVAQLPPSEHRLVVERPGSLAHCGYTARRLFGRLRTSENVVGVFANLVSHIATAAENRERVAFHVRFWNHEFVIIVRNGLAEVLQSFQDEYSFGWCLMTHGEPYLPTLLQHELSDIASADVQKRLFFRTLREDSPPRAEYNHAPLKTDKEIWDALYAEAVPGLACYLSLRERPQ